MGARSPMSSRPLLGAFRRPGLGPPQRMGSSGAGGRGNWTKRGSSPGGSQGPRGGSENGQMGAMVCTGWRGGGPCLQEQAGGAPASDSFLSAPPQAAPHSPAATWLWADPLREASGGQRSSPLSTEPTSLDSTTIAGSHRPRPGPFSRAPAVACREGGQQSGRAEPWAPCSLPPSHTHPAVCSLGRSGALPAQASRVCTCVCVRVHVCVHAHVCVVVQVPAPPPATTGAGTLSTWGTEGSIWAQPLGPFHRQETEAREAKATWCVSPGLLCVHSCLLYPAQPLPGVFPAGPLVSSPAQRSWEAVTMATGGSLGLLWAHCSVPTRA